MERILNQFRTMLLLFLYTFVIFGASAMKVSWLAPEKQFEGTKVSSSLGGIALAINEINADPSLLNGETIKLYWRDSNCHSKTTIKAMFEFLRSNKTDVFMGPVCSSAMSYTGMLASSRNISVFGYVSDSSELADKVKHSTLVRIFGPVNTVGKSFLTFLESNSWKWVDLISSSSTRHHSLATGIDYVFKPLASRNYTIIRWESQVDVNPDVDTIIKPLYDKVKKEARIIILCVPRAELRTWLLAAYDKGMADGDYVFFYIEDAMPSVAIVQEITKYATGDGRDHDAKQIYESLLVLCRKDKVVADFETKADAAAQELVWRNWAMAERITAVTVDKYAAYLHDAMLVLATAATDAKANTGAMHSKDIVKYARSRKFTGSMWATGEILLNEDGDREPDFVMLDLRSNGKFAIIAETEHTLKPDGTVKGTVEYSGSIIWGDGTEGPSNRPQDIPDCGFENEKCPNYVPYIVPSAVVGVLIIVAIVVFCIYRKIQYEREINSMVWKLDRVDLVQKKHGGGKSGPLSKDQVSLMASHASSFHSRLTVNQAIARSHRSLHKSASHVGSESHGNATHHTDEQLFVETAEYKGRMVAVKKVRKYKFKADRDLLVEMRTMTELTSHNIATFIGATTDPTDLVVVWEYCGKGSLQDVIWNDNIKLDDMFKYSISLDILKGLKYIQDSPLKCHGRLKSSNCIVDGRWVCKLTDHGLDVYKEGEEEDPEISEYNKSARFFWTAPEILRKHAQTKKLCKSHEGDMYAAAIIFKEIFSRSGPYSEYDEYTPEEILELIVVQEGSHPFRPNMGEVDAKMRDAVRQGWAEKPSDRPSVGGMIKDLAKINPFKTSNVMDNIMLMMERYSNNLEGMVEERTVQIQEEKKKSEVLLFRMLPKSVAEDLKHGKTIQAEHFNMVSIYFSDIVSFTSLAGASTPMQVVDLLNGLYTLWDSTIANHDVYKVETIGDAYMVVSGCPIKNGDYHMVEIANCAMDLLSGIMNFKVPHKHDYVLRIRIGLHSGSAVAGVVGLTMPRYCLFGDTVIMASKMESGGEPMRIQLSNTAYACLSKFSGYHLAERGKIDIKGKGSMTTYWLYGREGMTGPMPDFNQLSAEDNPKPKVLPISKGKTPKAHGRPSLDEPA